MKCWPERPGCKIGSDFMIYRYYMIDKKNAFFNQIVISCNIFLYYICIYIYTDSDVDVYICKCTIPTYISLSAVSCRCQSAGPFDTQKTFPGTDGNKAIMEISDGVISHMAGRWTIEIGYLRDFPSYKPPFSSGIFHFHVLFASSLHI